MDQGSFKLSTTAASTLTLTSTLTATLVMKYDNSSGTEIRMNGTVNFEDDPDAKVFQAVYLGYLWTALIIGLPGNMLIAMVYIAVKQKRTSDWFIFFLSVYDCAVCVFAVPLYLSIETGAWIATGSDLACKIEQFTIFTSQFSSVSILGIIAVDRYLKICQPTKRSLNATQARNLGMCTPIVSALVAAPILVWNGNVERRFCRVQEKYKDSIGVKIHLCSTFGFFLCMFFVVIFCYSQVCLVVRRRIRRHKENALRRKHLMQIPAFLQAISNVDDSQGQGSGRDSRNKKRFSLFSIGSSRRLSAISPWIKARLSLPSENGGGRKLLHPPDDIELATKESLTESKKKLDHALIFRAKVAGSEDNLSGQKKDEVFKSKMDELKDRLREGLGKGNDNAQPSENSPNGFMRHVNGQKPASSAPVLQESIALNQIAPENGVTIFSEASPIRPDGTGSSGLANNCSANQQKISRQSHSSPHNGGKTASKCHNTFDHVVAIHIEDTDRGKPPEGLVASQIPIKGDKTRLHSGFDKINASEIIALQDVSKPGNSTVINPDRCTEIQKVTESVNADRSGGNRINTGEGRSSGCSLSASGHNTTNCDTPSETESSVQKNLSPSLVHSAASTSSGTPATSVPTSRHTLLTTVSTSNNTPPPIHSSSFSRVCPFSSSTSMPGQSSSASEREKIGTHEEWLGDDVCFLSKESDSDNLYNEKYDGCAVHMGDARISHNPSEPFALRMNEFQISLPEMSESSLRRETFHHSDADKDKTILADKQYSMEESSVFGTSEDVCETSLIASKDATDSVFTPLLQTGGHRYSNYKDNTSAVERFDYYDDNSYDNNDENVRTALLCDIHNEKKTSHKGSVALGQSETAEVTRKRTDTNTSGYILPHPGANQRVAGKSKGNESRNVDELQLRTTTRVSHSSAHEQPAQLLTTSENEASFDDNLNRQYCGIIESDHFVTKGKDNSTSQIRTNDAQKNRPFQSDNQTSAHQSIPFEMNPVDRDYKQGNDGELPTCKNDRGLELMTRDDSHFVVGGGSESVIGSPPIALVGFAASVINGVESDYWMNSAPSVNDPTPCVLPASPCPSRVSPCGELADVVNQGNHSEKLTQRPIRQGNSDHVIDRQWEIPCSDMKRNGEIQDLSPQQIGYGERTGKSQIPLKLDDAVTCGYGNDDGEATNAEVGIVRCNEAIATSLASEETPQSYAESPPDIPNNSDRPKSSIITLTREHQRTNRLCELGERSQSRSLSSDTNQHESHQITCEIQSTNVQPVGIQSERDILSKAAHQFVLASCYHCACIYPLARSPTAVNSSVVDPGDAFVCAQKSDLGGENKACKSDQDLDPTGKLPKENFPGRENRSANHPSQSNLTPLKVVPTEHKSRDVSDTHSIKSDYAPSVSDTFSDCNTQTKGFRLCPACAAVEDRYLHIVTPYVSEVGTPRSRAHSHIDHNSSGYHTAWKGGTTAPGQSSTNAFNTTRTPTNGPFSKSTLANSGHILKQNGGDIQDHASMTGLLSPAFVNSAMGNNLQTNQRKDGTHEHQARASVKTSGDDVDISGKTCHNYNSIFAPHTLVTIGDRLESTFRRGVEMNKWTLPERNVEINDITGENTRELTPCNICWMIKIQPILSVKGCHLLEEILMLMIFCKVQRCLGLIQPGGHCLSHRLKIVSRSTRGKLIECEALITGSTDLQTAYHVPITDTQLCAFNARPTHTTQGHIQRELSPPDASNSCLPLAFVSGDLFFSSHHVQMDQLSTVSPSSDLPRLNSKQFVSQIFPEPLTKKGRRPRPCLINDDHIWGLSPAVIELFAPGSDYSLFYGIDQYHSTINNHGFDYGFHQGNESNRVYAAYFPLSPFVGFSSLFHSGTESISNPLPCCRMFHTPVAKFESDFQSTEPGLPVPIFDAFTNRWGLDPVYNENHYTECSILRLPCMCSAHVPSNLGLQGLRTDAEYQITGNVLAKNEELKSYIVADFLAGCTDKTNLPISDGSCKYESGHTFLQQSGFREPIPANDPENDDSGADRVFAEHLSGCKEDQYGNPSQWSGADGGRKKEIAGTLTCHGDDSVMKDETLPGSRTVCRNPPNGLQDLSVDNNDAGNVPVVCPQTTQDPRTFLSSVPQEGNYSKKNQDSGKQIVEQIHEEDGTSADGLGIQQSQCSFISAQTSNIVSGALQAMIPITMTASSSLQENERTNCPKPPIQDSSFRDSDNFTNEDSQGKSTPKGGRSKASTPMATTEAIHSALIGCVPTLQVDKDRDSPTSFEPKQAVRSTLLACVPNLQLDAPEPKPNQKDPKADGKDTCEFFVRSIFDTLFSKTNPTFASEPCLNIHNDEDLDSDSPDLQLSPLLYKHENGVDGGQPAVNSMKDSPIYHIVERNRETLNSAFYMYESQVRKMRGPSKYSSSQSWFSLDDLDSSRRSSRCRNPSLAFLTSLRQQLHDALSPRSIRHFFARNESRKQAKMTGPSRDRLTANQINVIITRCESLVMERRQEMGLPPMRDRATSFDPASLDATTRAITTECDPTAPEYQGNPKPRASSLDTSYSSKSRSDDQSMLSRSQDTSIDRSRGASFDLLSPASASIRTGSMCSGMSSLSRLTECSAYTEHSRSDCEKITRRSAEREHNITKLLGVITFLFVISWSVSWLVILVDTLTIVPVADMLTTHVTLSIARNLFLVNHFCNIVVYLVLSESFREKLVQCYRNVVLC